MKNKVTTWTSLATTLVTVILGILVATNKITLEQNTVLADMGAQIIGAIIALAGAVQGIIGAFSAKDELKAHNL